MFDPSIENLYATNHSKITLHLIEENNLTMLNNGRDRRVHTKPLHTYINSLHENGTSPINTQISRSYNLALYNHSCQPKHHLLCIALYPTFILTPYHFLIPLVLIGVQLQSYQPLISRSI